MCICQANVCLPQAATASDDLVVPSWMANRGDLLPKVSPQVMTTFKSILPHLMLSDDARDIPESFWSAARQVLELGENASLPFVWMYVDESVQASDVERFGKEKERILHIVSMDPIAGNWLVPIIRFRMDWVRMNLKAGTLDRIPFTADELSGMEALIIVQGTRADLENIRNLREELRASGATVAKYVWPIEGTPEERDAADHARRAERRALLHPFYQEYKWCEKHLGPVKSAALPNSKQADTSGPPETSTTVAPSRSVGTMAAPGQRQPRGWLLWLLVIVGASGGAVWLFTRKPSK